MRNDWFVGLMGGLFGGLGAFLALVILSVTGVVEWPF
jgi:hypothetical protein